MRITAEVMGTGRFGHALGGWLALGDIPQTLVSAGDRELVEGRQMEPEMWWRDLDEAVLRCLSDGAIDPAAIGQRLGLSADAVTSVTAMLAREGKARICLLAPVSDAVSVRSFWCSARAQKVTAEFAEDRSSSKPLTVNWCSAFVPATAVTCDKQCLGP